MGWVHVGVALIVALRWLFKSSGIRFVDATGDPCGCFGVIEVASGLPVASPT